MTVHPGRTDALLVQTYWTVLPICKTIYVEYHRLKTNKASTLASGPLKVTECPQKKVYKRPVQFERGTAAIYSLKQKGKDQQRWMNLQELTGTTSSGGRVSGGTDPKCFISLIR